MASLIADGTNKRYHRRKAWQRWVKTAHGVLQDEEVEDGERDLFTLALEFLKNAEDILINEAEDFFLQPLDSGAKVACAHEK